MEQLQGRIKGTLGNQGFINTTAAKSDDVGGVIATVKEKKYLL